MKTIEVPDEVYAALAERVMRSNKTLTEILRSLLDIKDRDLCPIGAPVPQISKPDEQLLTFILSSEYRMEASGIGKYLLIFGWLQKHAPEKFQMVERYQRGKRVYFSKNPRQIAESGKGVSVKRIPGTDFYAMVTMDNPTKRRVVGSLLSAMGYPRELCSKIAETIEDSGITRSHLLNEYVEKAHGA
jgi:negative regulator of replication initiation